MQDKEPVSNLRLGPQGGLTILDCVTHDGLFLLLPLVGSHAMFHPEGQGKVVTKAILRPRAQPCWATQGNLHSLGAIEPVDEAAVLAVVH